MKDKSQGGSSVVEEPPISIYEEIGRDIGRLVTKKQKQYGDSFGRADCILWTLYPRWCTYKSVHKPSCNHQDN